MTPKNWPVVHKRDGGIRPAGEPNECFYCQRKIGQTHESTCVMVTKRVLLRVATLDEKITGSWELDTPHSFEPEVIERMRNESSWCQNNIFGSNVVWDQRGAIKKLETMARAHGCLCGKLRFTFVRVVDNTPRRELQDGLLSLVR